ncbi:hypothetical protein HDV04_004300 [Boothiomyces sp. JEL0838]|nr:hypothetical protein HDV04_004300 [Boothiomyces sp. JEL0838]
MSSLETAFIRRKINNPVMEKSLNRAEQVINKMKLKAEESQRKDTKKIAKLEKEIANIKFSDSIVDINDEWIQFNGDIIRFGDLKFKHEDLQKHHINECVRIGNNYEHERLTLEQSYQDVVERTPYGYLNADNYDHFVKIKLEYTNQTREKFTLFCERVQLEMPALSHRKISSQYNWLDRKNSFEMQKECLQQMQSKIKSEYITSTIQHIIEEEAAIKAEQEYLKSKEDQLHKTEKRHQTLKQWRENKIAQFILHSEKRRKSHEEQLQKERELQLKEEKRRESIKYQLQLYKEELDREKEKQKELELELQQKLDAEKELQKSINEERVKVRQEERQKKLKEKERQYKQMLLERQDLERRLELLRQSVAIHAERYLEHNLAIGVEQPKILAHSPNIEKKKYKTNGIRL